MIYYVAYVYEKTQYLKSFDKYSDAVEFSLTRQNSIILVDYADVKDYEMYKKEYNDNYEIYKKEYLSKNDL